MANVIYNSFKQDIANGIIDLNIDTIKVMLVTFSYTPIRIPTPSAQTLSTKSPARLIILPPRRSRVPGDACNRKVPGRAEVPCGERLLDKR
jgi:hypothetical protein